MVFYFFQFGCRNITPYIIKYGKHPVTGATLKQDDLIPLTFHKNSDGNYSFALHLFWSLMVCVEYLRYGVGNYLKSW